MSLVQKPISVALVLFCVYGFTAELEDEKIIVSASRLPMHEESAMVLSVREESPVYQGVDLLRGIPGIAVSQSGQRASLAQVRVRGAEADHVLVFVDGVIADDPASQFNFGALNTLAVENVEVLNGPRSAIWGSQALAGVIHFRTEPSRTESTIQTTAGSLDTRDLRMDWSSRSGSQFLRASLAHTRSTGNNAVRVGDEKDGFTQSAANVIGSRELGKWNLRGNVRSESTRSDYDPYPADGDREVKIDRLLLGFFASADLASAWSNRLSLTRSATDTINFSEGSETNNAFGERVVLSWSNKHQMSDASSINWVLELNDESFEQHGPAFPWGDPNQRQNTTNKAIGLESLNHFGMIRVHASTRYDVNDAFKNSATWHVGLAMSTNRITWLLSASSGTKNPSFIDRFGYFPDAFLGNPHLKPERSLQYQAGFSWDLTVGKLKLIAFQADLSDEINGFAYDANANSFTARNLETESTRQGFETSLEKRWKSANLRLTATRLRSREGHEQEIRRPDVLGGLAFQYTGLQKWNLQTNISYTSDQFDLDFSTFPATRRTLDAYLLTNFAATRQLSKSVSLLMRVENAFDEDFQDVYGYRNAGRIASLGFRISG